MLGKTKKLKPKLFYNVSLEQKVPKGHPLRAIKEKIDFSFVRAKVANSYGARGNVSIDPEIILKLMFLLFYENVKSERQLASQLPLRLDWLWFCNIDIDEQTPNHSVISKARKRWGKGVFAEFFQNILEQCIQADLVDGTIIHIDSSMIDANASKNKLKPQLRKLSDDFYQQLESDDKLCKKISETDPDARIGKKYSKSTLGYKDHRVVDDSNGIITATVTTPANVNDDKVFQQAVDQHEANTDVPIEITVADKIYGTIDNYKYLHAKGVSACIEHQRRGCKKDHRFNQDKFIYDKNNDCFICPAGAKLDLYDKVGPNKSISAYRYRAKRKVCEQCEFFNQCVASKKHGRQVSRNVDAKYIQWADNCFSKTQRKKLLQRRMAKAEGSFADGANNHGFKRCRWRTIEKVEIQNLLIAAIQNLRKLMKLIARQKPKALATQVFNCIFTVIVNLLAQFSFQERIFIYKRTICSFCHNFFAKTSFI